MRPSATLPLLLVAVLAGCLGGGGGGDDDCTGVRTTFTDRAVGLQEALAAGPVGVPAETVDPETGMAFDGELPWLGAQVDHVAWNVAPPTASGSEWIPDATQGSLGLRGTGTDLVLTGDLPGSFDQAALAARAVEFLADVTDLEPEDRAAVVEGLTWTSGGGTWRTEAELSASVRMPPPLEQESTWKRTTDAGLRQMSDTHYTVTALVPVERLEWTSGGLWGELKVDEDDHALMTVESRGHTQEDARRMHRATLELVGWSGGKDWDVVHQANVPVQDSLC